MGTFSHACILLQMQAMSVMKRGMPPGGVNPVPIKVAVKDTFASPVKGQPGQPDKPSFVAAELNSQGTRFLHLHRFLNQDKHVEGMLRSASAYIYAVCGMLLRANM